MKTELTQINVAIAELLGFTNVSADGRFGHRDDLCGPGTGRCSLPDYHGDLNAIAQAEATLTPDEHYQFRVKLWEMTDARDMECIPRVNGEEHNRRYISATAAQRARAFLAVKGVGADNG